MSWKLHWGLWEFVTGCSSKIPTMQRGGLICGIDPVVLSADLFLSSANICHSDLFWPIENKSWYYPQFLWPYLNEKNVLITDIRSLGGKGWLVLELKSSIIVISQLKLTSQLWNWLNETRWLYRFHLWSLVYVGANERIVLKCARSERASAGLFLAENGL